MSATVKGIALDTWAGRRLRRARRVKYGETLDWYSDSIIAWAYYPLGVAQTAFDEKARQAAAVRA